MLKSGDLDITNISLDDAVTLEKAGYSTYPVIAAQVVLRFHGTYDPRAKGTPMADVRVRQALELAINQDEISNTFFYGKALPLMPPRVLYGLEDVDSDYWTKIAKDFYKYDPAQAKKLLADAGYPNGFSGLKLFLSAIPGAEFVPKLAEIIQSYWKAIGVNAEIVPMELGTYVQARAEPGDVLIGGGAFGSTGTLAPAIVSMEANWGSKGFMPLVSRKTAQGITSFTPDLDKLVYEAMTQVDQAKRQATIAQIIKMVLDTHTSIPFRQAPMMMAVSSKVKFDLKQPLEVPWPTQWAEMAQRR